MVGVNPFVRERTPSVTIPLDLVPIKLEFMAENNKTVDLTFNPDATNPACGLTTSPDERTLQSPLFQDHKYTVDRTYVGNVEYEDMFMRENFAKQVLYRSKINPGYGIVLSAVNRGVWTVQVPAADWAWEAASSSGACHGQPGGNMGALNFKAWDPFVQKELIPALQKARWTASTSMLNLEFANVVMYDGSTSNCCILGYHSGVSTTGGVQYYATSDYDSTQLFTQPTKHIYTGDVSGMAHELGEWINDPNGTNPVPAWGHIGQQPSCQGNLEVGDPLSGTVVPVTMANKLTYHPQELVFFSWFYRLSPSGALGNWYSSNGAFRTSAGKVCT